MVYGSNFSRLGSIVFLSSEFSVFVKFLWNLDFLFIFAPKTGLGLNMGLSYALVPVWCSADEFKSI